MARIFLSYAREDEPVAQRLAAALSGDHDVWWDRKLSGGSVYHRAIEEALDRSDRVLVLWSAHSVLSSWVRDEAEAGRDSGKYLPATIDGTPPPIGFRQFHTLDLSAWTAGGGDGALAALGQAIDGQTPAAREAPPARRGQQKISFVRTADGVMLAYSRTGQGPPIVKAANWLNHLESEWTNPVWMPMIDLLSDGRELLRYDERGNGMSDWTVPTLDFDLLVDDLETVAATTDWPQFDLFAISQGAPVAIAFATAHPGRVRRLVIVNGFAAGWKHSRDPATKERWEALCALAGSGWGSENDGFRQVFTSLFFPGATPELMRHWNRIQKESASPENAKRFMQLIGDIDVSPLLSKVAVPTLVAHCRGDQLVPFDAGRMMASRIPNALFHAIDSDNHMPLPTDRGWPALVASINDFLA